MLLSNTEKRNVLSAFLQEMGVRHTITFANKLYNEHPHKYNLFGLSRMLSDYNVANSGVRIEDKDGDLLSLDVPFIAQFGGDFVTVYRIDRDKVHYIWKSKEIKVSVEEFKESWSGVVLIAEPDEDSIEPEYKENKQKELFGIIQNYLLLLVIGIFALSVFVLGELYKSAGLTISLIINTIGIYISYLLILKQVHVQSDSADKICSLFKQSDCNNVLESPAAKFMGVISWSEVGIGYFISNAVIILFIPSLIPYLALINILALPYSFWSVWYQKVKAKQWCALCLVVQGLLWVIFVTNVLFGFIIIPRFAIFDIILTGCIYTLPYLIVRSLLPAIAESRKTENIRQQMNSLRMNDDLFLSLLKQQTRYEVDKFTSNILLGNPEAPLLVTVLTNPHCEPCGRMHKRIEDLLIEIGDKVCLQYIYSYFNKELAVSNKYLIGIFQNKTRKEIEEIYHEWFSEGKYYRESFYEKYSIDIETNLIKEEFDKHINWIKHTNISATPTILINGYNLPDSYKIEDLKYFSDLVVDTK